MRTASTGVGRGNIAASTRCTNAAAASRAAFIARSRHPCALHGTTACKLEAVAIRSTLTEWAASLDREWSLFMTMTFRRDVPRHHAMTAGSRFVRWCSAWRDPVLGTPLFRCLLWSAEEHLTGSVHLHAISACTPLTSVEHMRRSSRPDASFPRPRPCRTCAGVTDGPLWRRLKESWFAHWGIARIYPYDPQYRLGAERYVIKYILDEKCLDWGVVTA